jgi:hypothetical protein
VTRAPIRRLGPAVAALVLFGAAPARADTDVAVLGDTMFISADGAHNSMVLKIVIQPKYRTVDDFSTLVPGTQCVREPPADAHVVDCNGNIFNAFVGLGGGPDDYTPESYIELNLTELGEDGQDQLTGALGDDILVGNAGDDYSDGRGGNDVLNDGYPGTFGGGRGSGNDTVIGGGGNDYLDGGTFATTPDAGSGADLLDGGLGIDIADYSKRTVPLTLTEGAGANDGQDTGAGPGSEGDNLVAAETIIGGSSADVIGAGGGGNTVIGGAGDDALGGGGDGDALLGGDGDDTLDGGPGADLLDGERGTDTATYATRTQPVTASLDSGANDGEAGEGDNADEGVENLDGGTAGDRLTGDAGPNRLRAGAGDDTIDGGGGADAIDAGNDADTVSATDGATDTIACGPGADTVVADAFDVVAADCETVDRAAVPDPDPGPGGGPGGGSGTLDAIGLPESIRVKHGAAKAKVDCPASAVGGCAGGLLSVLNHGKKLAGGKFSIAAGDRAAVSMHLGAKARARLERRDRVTLEASATGAAPASRTVSVRH